jgi:hypothetical protein
LIKYIILTLVFCSFLSLYSGCGADPQWSEPFPDRLQIAVIDSIGIEAGDSCYVLGSIVDAEVSPTGSILLLDQSACCIREFSPGGIFVRIISGKGSGPGELLFPMEMLVLPDGRLIVEDMMKRALVILSSEGESQAELTDWELSPPTAIVSVDSNHIAGCAIGYNMESIDLSLIFKPTLYSLDDAGTELVFHADTLVIENAGEAPLTPTGMLGYSMMTSDCRNGRIFYANMSTDHHEVRCWDIHGNPSYSFSLGIPPVERTAGELNEEKEYARIQFAALGMNTLPAGFEPDPLHTLVVGLGVDKDGNLWVERGTEAKPVFDIVDSEGMHIGTAEFPRTGHHWKFCISPYGSLAWNLDPVSGYQEIYIIELPVCAK